MQIPQIASAPEFLWCAALIFVQFASQVCSAVISFSFPTFYLVYDDTNCWHCRTAEYLHSSYVLLIALWVRFFVFAHICRSTNTHKISLNERTFRRNLEKVAEGKFVVPSTKVYSNHLHFENLSNFALPSPRHLRHLIGWLLSLTHSLKTSMSNPIRSLCQSNHLIGFLPPTL